MFYLEGGHPLSWVIHPSDSNESTCKVGELGSIPGLGGSPGEGNGYPLLENSMDKGAWQATVHGVAKSQTWLNDFRFISPPNKSMVKWAPFFFFNKENYQQWYDNDLNAHPLCTKSKESSQ